MDTLTAIQQRRAVKHYDPNHQMSESEIQTLMEHVLLSPTSFNIQNWRFVIVDDPELRQQIRAASWNQAQVTDASLLVLLCGNLNAWQQQPERYWQNAPEAVRQQLVPMIIQFYEGSEALQRDEAMRSCGIAAQTLMLAAKAMGYDTCPMIGFDPQAVADIIQLPADHLIGMMITVGKAVQPARERGGQLPLSEVVIRNRFPST
ncbi:nitroreductase family protein [Limnothrix sp. FACHB-1083]|uniref:nitroreductase family protein n=1 Tax=unclassified Limnothrix TaxID=2632864 RepID=UPI00168157E6|nr:MULTISPECIES: nitroreductase family protein [unclassified Limnothrix]MBD2161810.1 nitroreductase family protein [Limnothrix sp. FACHB-1083]MBD2192613.1 nitroreductase family protein [Limnothrix sp. FACHB-1088]